MQFLKEQLSLKSLDVFSDTIYLNPNCIYLLLNRIRALLLSTRCLKQHNPNIALN